MNHISVADIQMRSPLNEAMSLKPSGRSSRAKKKIVMTLILTSLVDAFSIMLLYLLTVNTGNGSTLDLLNTNRLPIAIKTEALHQGTLVRIEGQRYFLGDQQIDGLALAGKLQEKQAELTRLPLVTEDDHDKAESLIIQADRNVDFSMLTPVIRAGSLSGFHKFKFAVLQGESRR